MKKYKKANLCGCYANGEGIELVEFKKLPLKRKFYYIACCFIGIIIFPFYFAYIGVKKLIMRCKQWKKKQN